MDQRFEHPAPAPEVKTASGELWGATRAFSVHILTASGAAFCLLALLAATAGNWARMFLWLGFALIIDAFDGAVARRLDVKERLPRWSGDTLDLVVDYVSYVFVPTYAIIAGGLLPTGIDVVAGFGILITSAIYFADRRMKTADNYFRGFPALWNLVAFYLFLLRPGPWPSAVLVFALCTLTFVPFSFIHPVRVARMRVVNIAGVLIWAVLAIAALAADMNPSIAVKVALCALAIYFVAVGLWRAKPT